MAYCDDITTLPHYDSTNEHFLFTDIHFGKGKARNVKMTKMLIDSTEDGHVVESSTVARETKPVHTSLQPERPEIVQHILILHLFILLTLSPLLPPIGSIDSAYLQKIIARLLFEAPST